MSSLLAARRLVAQWGGSCSRSAAPKPCRARGGAGVALLRPPSLPAAAAADRGRQQSTLARRYRCHGNHRAIPCYGMSTLASASPDDEDSDSDRDEPDRHQQQQQHRPFESLPSLHPSSLHAVTHKMRLTNMTEIQSKTFEAASSGRDVLGRARTGTGKTLAFLLPAIESALRDGRVPGPHGYACDGDVESDGGGAGASKKKGGIAILILSPTRELAMQIHSQAQLLTSSHSNGLDRLGKYKMTSQVMYGGSSRGIDVKKLEDNLPYVLVATPGRLIDHMKSSYVRGAPFREIIGNVSVWVLDEADRCLDMGFRNDMEYILQHKPREAEAAQTLLFSATLPKDLRSIMASHMRKDFLTVDCVHDVDPATHTNANVDQTYVTLPGIAAAPSAVRTGNVDGPPPPSSPAISALVSIIEDIVHVQNPDDYKIVVFFPTTSTCQYFTHLFNKVFRIPAMEIHSKKTQANRTVTSDKFRKFGRGVLFTTDVSARGVDYPNVTHVIQFGSADSRETYIHRLGRTGRAGKVGRGVIICGSRGEEGAFVKRELEGLNVSMDERYQRLVDGDSSVVHESDANGHRRRREINDERMRKIFDAVQGMGRNRDDEQLQKLASQAYRSLLGYNLTQASNLGVRSKQDVVNYVNSLGMQFGFGERSRLPRLGSKIVQTLGLQGVRGINVGGGGDGGGGDYGRSYSSRDGARRGGYGGGRGGDGMRRRDDGYGEYDRYSSGGGGYDRQGGYDRRQRRGSQRVPQTSQDDGGGNSRPRWNLKQWDNDRWDSSGR